MPTDMPVAVASPLLDASIALHSTLAASTAATVPATATFTIKKGENLAKRKGIKSTATQYILPFSAVSVSDPTNSCIEMLLNVNVDKLPTQFNPPAEWSAAIMSNVAGVLKPQTSACIVEAARPNINWKAGAKNPVATVTITKKFVEALRAAIPGDLVLTVAIGGGVSTASSGSGEEDK